MSAGMAKADGAKADRAKADEATDAGRIAALLAGRRPTPRARARSLADLLRPLSGLHDLPGLPATRVSAGTARSDIASNAATEAAAASPDGDAAMRWAALVPVEGKGPSIGLGVPTALAARIGTVLLGGLADAADEVATPIDWRMTAELVDSLGALLAAPRRLDTSNAAWSDAWEAPEGGALDAMLSLSGGESVPHVLLLRIPASLVAAPPSAPSGATRAGRPRETGARVTSGVELRARATLDLAGSSLGDAIALRVGSVLPLATGLDAVDLRIDGRRLARGALGHARGRLCLRLAEPPPAEGGFAALRPPAASGPAGPAQAASGNDGASEGASERERAGSDVAARRAAVERMAVERREVL